MRIRISGFFIALGVLACTSTYAQSIQEKDQVLAWRTANNNTVKLITYAEYSQLSPIQQAEIDALEAKII